mmetsp:Transcript_14074/g.12036  ORF Transcript_14074/g.12036 Transcript_14074/m.12036 type:complete len:141 (+) Transcript_14074:583-1005(+)|eukprot:CAMPEP_0114584064 /NCGR_PEP_ID=MMETSP0125-20121206/7782_1 /TAXON_ID=485358 ORGANISM="Aristerostoma sp., Strain ATCC 50986" /NCGR_SAMPLE_ID=MMETSP0125 /ASSEMBLY_ACC=CAM_ASM_000245 /LENGTH=140 /DNA_ID=CAMNT_0001778117 /DNA_START=509 /DNA_END=931 /DNA_ORIENTATION=+
MEGDPFIKSRGSSNYRAPELAKDKCEDCFAADVYSIGIVLFAFMTKKLPYMEGKVQYGKDMQKVLLNDPNNFWHELVEIHPDFYALDGDFKVLFMAMVRKNPEERVTMAEIKKSSFYKGPVYDDETLKEKMSKMIQISTK